MSQPKVDPQTAARVRACLQRCTTRGSDPVRALDELGLLWHPARQQHASQEVLTVVSDALDDATWRQLAAPGVVPANVLDAKKLIVAWLRKIAANAVPKKQQ